MGSRLCGAGGGGLEDLGGLELGTRCRVRRWAGGVDNEEGGFLVGRVSGENKIGRCVVAMVSREGGGVCSGGVGYMHNTSITLPTLSDSERLVPEINTQPHSLT